jgi:hypothetical protein
MANRKSTQSVRRNGKHSPEFMAYRNAKTRCTNHRNRGWKYYGGRGIQFKFSCFREFWDELGKRPSPNHQLDRIKNDGDYERGNVRWATYREQYSNRRGCSIYSFKGQSHTLRSWSEILGINYHTLHTRLYLLRWPVEKVLGEPLREKS